MTENATGAIALTSLAESRSLSAAETNIRSGWRWLLSCCCWRHRGRWRSAQEQPADATATDADSGDRRGPARCALRRKRDQSKLFGRSLGTAVKTIGEDELHIIKSPFSVSALKWDALVVGATGVLIANDESVRTRFSPSWHNTSINISNAGVYGLGAAAGGIFVTGLITHNEHATDTGIRSAEASVDSVILYAALKAILARQRPYTGAGEGKFFSGNWTSRLFPFGTRDLRLDARLRHGARISELADASADVRSGNRGQHNPCDRRSALPC